MIRTSYFLVFIQCSLIHLLRFDQLALIFVKKAQIMTSTAKVFVVHFIVLFNTVILLHASICMWDQALLHHLILWLRLLRHSEFNNHQSKPRQINFAAIDRLCTSVMHDRMHRVTFRILMRLNQEINEQFHHHFFKSQFLSNKIMQSISIFRISIVLCQQLKSEILMIKICSKLKKLRRCEIQSFDMIVEYHSDYLNVVICIVTHSRYFRLKLRSRRVVQSEIVLTTRFCLLHVSIRLNDDQRKFFQFDHQIVYFCLSFSQSNHEHEAREIRLFRVDKHLRTLLCRIWHSCFWFTLITFVFDSCSSTWGNRVVISIESWSTIDQKNLMS